MNLPLFGQNQPKSTFLPPDAPLAARLRPNNLDDFIGQTHLVGEGKMLRRMIANRHLSSLIFFGTPGTGKTTLARIIAHETEAQFVEINATESNTKELRTILNDAKAHLRRSGQKSLLFVDEIHRFNKAQQDVLLPDVENGFIVLIGATTGNPHFSINSPLLSRSQLFEFFPLDAAAMGLLIDRACRDEKLTSGFLNISLTPEAISHLIAKSDGDGRRILNALEMSALAATPDGDNLEISTENVEQAVQNKALRYDKDGDSHYDVISAFIKSMRGSDPNATVYWLARMIDAGEDIRFIARRIVICASEDVGNASPQALMLANAAAQAVEFVGMPEARIILSQAAIFIATSPKSNASYLAINAAMDDVNNGLTFEVPTHLKGTGYPGARSMGRGKEYKYAHDYEGHFVDQDYLPEEKQYFTPSSMGYEAKIKERMDAWARLKKKSGKPSNQD